MWLGSNTHMYRAAYCKFPRDLGSTWTHCCSQLETHKRSSQWARTSPPRILVSPNGSRAQTLNLGIAPSNLTTSYFLTNHKID